MKMLKTGATVTSTTTNYKDIIQKFLGSSDAFSFMSSVKGTPSYWKQFLYDVLAMVKQLGITTLFLTLSCADLNPIQDGSGAKRSPTSFFPVTSTNVAIRPQNFLTLSFNPFYRLV